MNKHDREAWIRHFEKALESNPGAPYAELYVSRRLVERTLWGLKKEERP